MCNSIRKLFSCKISSQGSYTLKSYTSNKLLKLKEHNKVIELKDNCNLFSRCALVKDKRNIDMRTVIGEHELRNVPFSLFSPDGSLINGGVGKSSTVDDVLTRF